MVFVKAELKGLKEAQKKAEQIVKDLHGGAFLNAMREATLTVQRAAKINSPVDTGRLRASIVPEIRTVNGPRVHGIVGSVVRYAPKVEQPGRVRGVGRRPYLEPAFKENKDKVIKLLDSAVRAIVEQ